MSAVEGSVTERIERLYQGDEYVSKNPSWGTSDSEWKARQVVSMLERHGLSPASIGEVGCGAGAILAHLRDRNVGDMLRGFEISDHAIRRCRTIESEKLSFHHGDILETDDRFDVLLCLDVFEHVPNYLDFLDRLRKHADYHIFHIPIEMTASAVVRDRHPHARQSVGHLHFFSRSTALSSLKDAGYSVEDHFYTIPFAKDGVPMKSWQQRVLQTPRRLLAAVSPHFVAKTVGGCSLMVLARGNAAG